MDIGLKMKLIISSGIKGVSLKKNEEKWKSYINCTGEQKSLGYYKSFDNAVCARLAGEQCLDWDKIDINSPAFKYVKENIQCH